MVDILNDCTKDCVYFSFTFIHVIKYVILFILYFNIPLLLYRSLFNFSFGLAYNKTHAHTCSWGVSELYWLGRNLGIHRGA